MRETDNWPFVKARWFTPFPAGQRRRPRVIVIHDMEYPERSTAAEDVAHYFATTATQASAHLCIDVDSIVQCVKDNDIAWAAPGCNNDGLQLELAGYARQTRADWLDAYSTKLLANAADAAAQYTLKYTNIPPVHLTNEELRAGKAGIVGHAQVSAVYRKSDHVDPGPAFPWDVFMPLVVARRCAIEAVR